MECLSARGRPNSCFHGRAERPATPAEPHLTSFGLPHEDSRPSRSDAVIAAEKARFEDIIAKFGKLQTRQGDIEAMISSNGLVKRVEQLEGAMQAMQAERRDHAAPLAGGHVAANDGDVVIASHTAQRTVIQSGGERIDLNYMFAEMEARIRDEMTTMIRDALKPQVPLHEGGNGLAAIPENGEKEGLLQDGSFKLDAMEHRLAEIGTLTLTINTDVDKFKQQLHEMASRVSFLESMPSGDSNGDAKAHAADAKNETATQNDTAGENDARAASSDERKPGELPGDGAMLDLDELPKDDDRDAEQMVELSNAMLDYHVDVESCYTLQASMWDAGLFCGMTCIGKVGTFLVGMALATNIMVQIVFSVVVYSQFLDNPLPGGADPFNRWRWKDGQSYTKTDTFTGESLSSRVCNSDQTLSEATGISNTLDMIESYRKELLPGAGVGAGKVLALMCIFVFSVTILAEIDAALNFARALWRHRSHSTLLTVEGEKIRIKGLSGRRLCVATAFATLRTVVAIALLFAGGWWLALNTGIEDLLLNAAALKFVLDVDEILFTSFCPQRVKILIEHVVPLRLPKVARIGGIGTRVPLNWFYCLVIVTGMWVALINPMETDMNAIASALCDGPTDFVVGVQSATGQLFIGTSTPTNPDTPMRFAMKAVKEVLERFPSNPEKKKKDPPTDEELSAELQTLTYSTSVGDKSFQSLVSVGMASYVSASRHRCRDRNLKNDQPRLEAIRSRTDIRNGTQCTDFVEFCTDFKITLVRLSCPETCGCGMPRQALYADGPGLGCSRDICRDDEVAVAALKAIPCEDASIAELNKTTVWKRFWDQYTNYWGDRSPFYNAMRKNATSFGCNFESISYLCAESESLASVVSFCPTTCGCREGRLPGCPKTCSVYTTPMRVYQLDGVINKHLQQYSKTNITPFFNDVVAHLSHEHANTSSSR